jgi:hypothetical protein
MRLKKYVAIPFITSLLVCGACRKKQEVLSESPLIVYKDAAFTNFFKRTTGFIAGDVAYSIALPNQKVLWLFGDSYIDSYDATTQTVPCLFQVNNCALLHNANDLVNAQTLIGNQVGKKSLYKIFPDASNKQLWVGNGYLLNDTIYQYLQGITITNTSGNFGFVINGQDFIGKMKYPEMTVVDYAPLPAMDSIFFGSAIIKDDVAGWVYAYGVKTMGLGSNVYLARFKANTPTLHWEFYTGTNWSTNLAHKQPIAQGASYSVQVSKIKNKYVLLTSYFSVGCDQGNEIHSRIADKPEGPFINDKKIWQVNDSLQGHLPFFYFPVAHPEFINAKNELLVTYCINGYEPCIAACSNGRRDPNTYRPKAIRVPLALIDESLR